MHESGQSRSLCLCMDDEYIKRASFNLSTSVSRVCEFVTDYVKVGEAYF
jgi:hypothetical protein